MLLNNKKAKGRVTVEPFWGRKEKLSKWFINLVFTSHLNQNVFKLSQK